MAPRLAPRLPSASRGALRPVWTGGGVWSVDWVDEPVHLYPDLASLATRLAARLEVGIYSASGTGGALRQDFDLRSDPLVRGCVFEVYWHPGPTDEPVVPAFRNLTAMIRAVVRRFERGGYWWDPDDRFLQERPDVLDELIAVERREARGDCAA